MKVWGHTVPWYISLLPSRWQVAWIWLSYFRSGGPFVYPGDFEELIKRGSIGDKWINVWWGKPDGDYQYWRWKITGLAAEHYPQSFRIPPHGPRLECAETLEIKIADKDFKPFERAVLAQDAGR